MSERALGFVEEWVSENIQAADAPAGDDGARAKMLATACLADANAQGISAAEIGEAIDDLPAFMAGAIAEANEREAHRLEEDEGDEDAAEAAEAGGAEDADEAADDGADEPSR